MPSLTYHYVTIAFAPPSCLPWLILALALVAPFLSHRCQSMRSLRLLPPICLSFSLAGCIVPSHCAVSASRCLTLRRHLSLTCRLVVALPLVVPPPPCVSSPPATASCNAWAGCHVASNNAALLFAQMRDDPQYGGSGAQERGNWRCQSAISASLLCAVAITVVAQAGCCQRRQGAIVVHT